MLWGSPMMTVWAAGCALTVLISWMLLEKWY